MAPSSAWPDFVKQYAKNHGISYHEALMIAGPEWKELKAGATTQTPGLPAPADVKKRVRVGGSIHSSHETHAPRPPIKRAALKGPNEMTDYKGPDGLPWGQPRDPVYTSHFRGAPTNASVSTEQNRRRGSYIDKLAPDIYNQEQLRYLLKLGESNPEMVNSLVEAFKALGK
jgi:hypothetical protein